MLPSVICRQVEVLPLGLDRRAARPDSICVLDILEWMEMTRMTKRGRSWENGSVAPSSNPLSGGGRDGTDSRAGRGVRAGRVHCGAAASGVGGGGGAAAAD